MLFSFLPRQALLDRACASLRQYVLCHVTYDTMGPPPLSARLLSRDLSHDRAARVLFCINCPPPPSWPVYGGGLCGPRCMYGPDAISMKVEWVQGAPLHSHTQTSYAGTRGNTRQRAYMPATIVIARGLLCPMPVFLVAFFCSGGKG